MKGRVRRVLGEKSGGVWMLTSSDLEYTKAIQDHDSQNASMDRGRVHKAVFLGAIGSWCLLMEAESFVFGVGVTGKVRML